MPSRATTPPEVTASWDGVLARRLSRQFLTGPPARELIPLVRRLSGVHAQLTSAAEAAVRLRSDRLGPEDVRRALAEDRTLVKTWTVRGTLHLLPAEDLPLWTAALVAGRKFARPASFFRYHDVEPADLDAIEEVVPQVVSATPMTREALARAVVKETGREHLAELLLSGWGSLLKKTAAHGGLAFGPPDGTSVTFVSPRAWLGEWTDLDPAESLAEVIRRYLDVHGPASVDELVGWGAFEPRPVRAALAALGDDVVEVGTEEHRGWATRSAAAEIASAEPDTSVRLLGGFDPYVTGSLRQLGLLVPAGRKGAVSRTSGWISPVLVDGGRIVGTWTSETKRGRLVVEIAPFGRLRRGVKSAAADEAAGWATHAAAPLTLTWT